MSFALVVQLLVAGTPALPVAEASPPATPEEAPSAPPEAATEPPASAPPAPAALEWYGWEILVADSVGIALAAGVPQVGVVYGLTYWAAPPFIHIAHRNPWRGGQSFLLRLGLPFAGALVGYGAGSGYSGYGPALYAMGGAAIGMLSAIVIDIAFLAWGPARPAPARPASAALHLVPVAGAVRGTPFAGVAGTF